MNAESTTVPTEANGNWGPPAAGRGGGLVSQRTGHTNLQVKNASDMHLSLLPLKLIAKLPLDPYGAELGLFKTFQLELLLSRTSKERDILLYPEKFLTAKAQMLHSGYLFIRHSSKGVRLCPQNRKDLWGGHKGQLLTDDVRDSKA